MKLLLSGTAIALTFAAFLPSIGSIRSDRTRPHLFSWLIWGVTTLLVFLAQWAGAASALPFWFLTADPLPAVVILTLVDLLGFGPTLRRAYAHPDQERIGFFSLFVLCSLLVLLSLERLTLTTALYPAAVGLACVGVVVLLGWRRRASLA